MEFVIIVIIILLVGWCLFINDKHFDDFSVIYPFNPRHKYSGLYQPYYNYQQCMEDMYGKVRCVNPWYFNNYLLPNYRRHPVKYRRYFKRKI